MPVRCKVEEGERHPHVVPRQITPRRDVRVDRITYCNNRLCRDWEEVTRDCGKTPRDADKPRVYGKLRPSNGDEKNYSIALN